MISEIQKEFYKFDLGLVKKVNNGVIYYYSNVKTWSFGTLYKCMQSVFRNSGCFRYLNKGR